jgi:acyl-CoA hydrolase
LDEASAIYAMRRLGYSNIVTVSMDDVSFKTPGRLGDIIQIYSAIEKVGRTSIHVLTSAFSTGQKMQEKKEIIQCKIIFVCLDESGKPFPYPEIHKTSLEL